LSFAGSKQFFLQSDKLNYEQSKEKCKSLGFEIASFDSRSEAKQVLDAVLKLTNAAWVGIERKGREFVNRKGIKVDLPWAYGEPNNAKGKEKCVEISNEHNGYNDFDCDSKFSFVCQTVA
jgi:hypothetical protein